MNPLRSARIWITLALGVTLPLVLWSALPLGSSGSTASTASLQQKVERLRSKIEFRRGKEQTLTAHISKASRKINRIEGRITVLRTRQSRIQVKLDDKRARLVKTQDELRKERARLARLKARLEETRAVLSRRLVEIYRSDRPDLITVALNADGFAELIERSESLKRINKQDREIITLVKSAKKDANATARRLDLLERRQQAIMATVLTLRNEAARNKQELLDRQVGWKRARTAKAAVLGKTRTEREHLEGELEEASAKIQSQLSTIQQQNAGSFNQVTGPIQQGSGSMGMPVNGASITGVFGEQRPGHLHSGTDMAAPEGTPIYAAKSGKVVIMENNGGGYGLFTCIQHTASMSTCYAHQSSFATSVGASVSQGQVIGAVGNTGHSFGAHLHFEVRINGSPVDPMGYL